MKFPLLPAALFLTISAVGFIWINRDTSNELLLQPKSEVGDNLNQGAGEARLNSASVKQVMFSMGGLVRFVTFDWHENGVDFHTRETVNGKLYSWEKAVTTPLALETIACRTAEDIVVAGLDELTGDIVISRWRYEAPVGSLASSHPRYPNDFGISVPLHLTSVSVVGNSFVEPGDRELPHPTKQTIYRGTDFSGVKAMAVDPEGRFVLVQDSGTNEVYRVRPGQAVEKVMGVEEIPELDDSFILGTAYQLGTLDRVYTLHGWPFDGGEVVVFHDSNNDGNLEQPIFLSSKEFSDGYPDEIADPVNPWVYLR